MVYYYRSSKTEPALSYGARSGLYTEAEAQEDARRRNRREATRFGRYEVAHVEGELYEVVWVDYDFPIHLGGKPI